MPTLQSGYSPNSLSPKQHENNKQPGQVFFRALPTVLTVVGLMLVFYVAAQYAWMFIEQRRFSRELELQTMPGKPNAPQVSKSTGEVFARLVIPRIQLDVVVVEGTTRKALLVGPGHLNSTAAPGEPGNSVLAGHRDTFFRRLGELARGDSINVSRGGKEYRYRVTRTQIVDPASTEVLQTTPGYHLTLITCYPFHYLGPAPKRFIVFADLADRAAEVPTPAPKPPA
jgi:sortase A